MKILRSVSSILIGLVFIFSGVVKAIDPLGSAYKFHDYFMAFNMGWLDWLSLPLGIMLCTAEFIAGFSVITGIRQRTGIWLILLMMILFTPLTLILALTNPVSDCGCFGDAIHLTNWQTFWKNIIFIILTLIVFTARKHNINVYKSLTEWIIICALALIFVLFSLGNLRFLPVIDFLPYKTEVRIADMMVIPEGAEPDKYITTFIYEKDGEQKEFTLDNYPADDTTWKFIDQKSLLLKKGYQPPIHDFSINQIDGGDITGQILSDPGYTLLMISKKISEAGSTYLKEGFDLGNHLAGKGVGFYVLTASATSEMQNYNNGLIYCSVDETTLKTMVRANPGYILIKDGIITGKWSQATLPDKEEFSALFAGTVNNLPDNSRSIFIVFTFITALSLILFILVIIKKKVF